jgi:serine/threonine protein kinase
MQDGSASVVVKQLLQSGGATHTEIKEFFREVEALKDLVHPNLLALYGVITHPGEEGVAMSMVLEGRGQGILKRVLDSARSAGHADKSLIYDTANVNSAAAKHDIVMSPAGRLRLMLGVARALSFLHSKNIVLRDLATRNCILSSGGVLRVGDYGQRFEEFPEDYVRLKGKKAGDANYAVRWMAAESITDPSVWTRETDVWSWAVTAWEIASLGLRPHGDVADAAVPAHISGGARLPTGRLDIAENISTAITQAFEPVPELRPTTEQLEDELESALSRLGAGLGNGVDATPPYDPHSPPCVIRLPKLTDA